MASVQAKPQLCPERLVHRLRNPLTTIMSCSNQLLDLTGDIAAEDRMLLQWIAAAAEAQNQTINRFLALYGDVTVTNRRFDLMKMVQGVVYKLKRDCHSQIEIAAPDTALWVEIDGCHFRQALWEVITNALEIDTGRPVEINIQPGDSSVVIKVSNQLDEPIDNFRARFAEPFYSTKPGHSGLGLAIAKRYLTLMDGDCYLGQESSEAVVCITVPLCGEPTENSSSRKDD
jgi:two-component system sensor histidine kinase FlrB